MRRLRTATGTLAEDRPRDTTTQEPSLTGEAQARLAGKTGPGVIAERLFLSPHTFTTGLVRQGRSRRLLTPAAVRRIEQIGLLSSWLWCSMIVRYARFPLELAIRGTRRPRASGGWRCRDMKVARTQATVSWPGILTPHLGRQDEGQRPFCSTVAGGPVNSAR